MRVIWAYLFLYTSDRDTTEIISVVRAFFEDLREEDILSFYISRMHPARRGKVLMSYFTLQISLK